MRLANAAIFLLLAVLGGPAISAELVIPEDGYVVSSDLSQLPEPVATKRAELIAAAQSGDISKLKAIFDAQSSPVTVSFGDPEDPIAYLKGESKDGEGYEILAILADLLDAPFAASEDGEGKVFYVWPYLAQMEGIGEVATPADKVVGIQVAGYDTFKTIQEFGVWIWWRVYIDGNGSLSAFVAGD